MLLGGLARVIHAHLSGVASTLDRGFDLGLGAGRHRHGRGLDLLGALLLLGLARGGDLGDIGHARGEVATVVHEDARAAVVKDDLDFVIGQLLDHEADVERRVMNHVAVFIRVANRKRASVTEVGIGGTRERVFPGHPLGGCLLATAIGITLGTVATRLTEGVNLATNHALHATYFVLVHADDRMSRVRFAAWGRAIRLDLSPDLISFFFEDGVHPCLFLDDHVPQLSVMAWPSDCSGWMLY